MLPTMFHYHKIKFLFLAVIKNVNLVAVQKADTNEGNEEKVLSTLKGHQFQSSAHNELKTLNKIKPKLSSAQHTFRLLYNETRQQEGYNDISFYNDLYTSTFNKCNLNQHTRPKNETQKKCKCTAIFINQYYHANIIK